MAERRQPSSAAPLLWLMVVIAGLLGAGWFLWTRDTRRGGAFPELSVRRTDDQGAALVYRLYERARLNPAVWDDDLGRLTGRGMLILIAPAVQERLFGAIPAGSRGELLPDEVRALDEWVKQGNVVAVLSRDGNDLFSGLGLIVDEPKGASKSSAEPVQPSQLARGVGAVRTQTDFGFKFGRMKAHDPVTGIGIEEDQEAPAIPAIPPERWTTLFVKRTGPRSVPQVVCAARGKGLYVAVNDWYPASNLGMTQADDAQFMLNLARLRPAGGTIWFDEYHKRNVDRNVLTYFRDRRLIPGLVYALLLVALLFWRTGSRLGEPAPLVVDRRRDSVEYVRAAASLYRNAGMTREALTTMYADFRRRLAGALRTDQLTDLDEVGRRYERRTGRPGVEARQALIETEAALARRRLTEDEALQYAARLAQIDEALSARRSAAAKKQQA